MLIHYKNNNPVNLNNISHIYFNDGYGEIVFKFPGNTTTSWYFGEKYVDEAQSVYEKLMKLYSKDINDIDISEQKNVTEIK